MIGDLTSSIGILILLAVATVSAILIFCFGDRLQGKRYYSIYPAMSAIQVVLTIALPIASLKAPKEVDAVYRKLLHFIMLLFILTEIIVVTLYISRLVNLNTKKIILAVTSVYIIFWALRSIITFPYKEYGTMDLIIQNMFGIILTGIFLSNLLFERSQDNLLEKKEFWVVSSNFLYFCVTTPITIVNDILMNEHLGYMFELIISFSYSIVFICWTIALTDRNSTTSNRKAI